MPAVLLPAREGEQDVPCLFAKKVKGVHGNPGLTPGPGSGACRLEHRGETRERFRAGPHGSIDRPRRLGILTSGGDCAGLNAVIRAVTPRATQGYGFEVWGIHEATHGLLQRPVSATQLTPDSVKGILHLGGTILRTTNRDNPFSYPSEKGRIDCSAEVAEGYRLLGLEAPIGVGGDGSLAILRRLAQEGGLNLIGIPKTIDNDLGHTERAVGFSTAVMVATEALDRLHVTAASHNRVMVLEVMGRDAGHIALTAGVAGGADVILIPEIAYELERICAKVEERRRAGRNFCLVIVAESALDRGAGADLHRRARPVLLWRHRPGDRRSRRRPHRGREPGHRAGPCPAWWLAGPARPVLGSAFGVAAVDLAAKGQFDRVVGWQNRRVVDVPIADACSMYQAVSPDDPPSTLRADLISFGD